MNDFARLIFVALGRHCLEYIPIPSGHSYSGECNSLAAKYKELVSKKEVDEPFDYQYAPKLP